MTKTKNDVSSIVILIVFILSYFLIKPFVNSFVLLAFLIAIITSASAFFLYKSQKKLIVKIGIIAGGLSVLFLALYGLKSQSSSHSLTGQNFNGTWVTDSSEKYIIKIRIKDDSAYLSQSPEFKEVAHTFEVSGDDIIMENTALGNILSWEYKLDDKKIVLYNNKDSLLLYRK